MNIIIVHDSFKESATFKHIMLYANQISLNNHNVMLVTYNDKDGTPFNDLKEVHFKYIKCKLKYNALEKSFKKELLDFKPDIIHSFCNKYELYVAYLIKKSTNAKLILHYEDNFEKIFFNRMPFLKAIKILLSGIFFLNVWPWYNLLLEKRLLKHVDAFDVLTDNLQKYLEEKSLNKPIQKIYPPVDLEFFHPKNDGLTIRKNLDIQEKFIIMHSGTIFCYWIEGFEKFFKAVNLVKKDIPELKLIFTGKKIGNSDLFYNFIRNYNLQDDIIDLKYIKDFNDIPKYLAMADILFEPQSLYIFDEYRLPSKIHNYMAAGKPIITFSNGFMKELTQDNLIKIDFQKDSYENIAEKIIMLYKNPELREKLGKNARKKAELLFDKTKNTQELLEFYKLVLSK